jgi:hypothetical protein
MPYSTKLVLGQGNTIYSNNVFTFRLYYVLGLVFFSDQKRQRPSLHELPLNIKDCLLGLGVVVDNLILAIQDVEIGRIVVPVQTWAKKVSEIPLNQQAGYGGA